MIDQCVLNVQPTPLSLFIVAVTSYKGSIYEAPHYVNLPSTFAAPSYFGTNILNLCYSEVSLCLFNLVPPYLFSDRTSCTIRV